MLFRMVALCVLISSTGTLSAQQKITVACTIHEKDLIPEGITYDPVEEAFYIGSIHKHKVIKINNKGVVRDFISPDQDGVGVVLGLKVSGNRHLWFCSNPPSGNPGKSTVFQYELTTGKLIARYVWDTEGEEHEFNDLQFLKGSVYITDSMAGAVYKIEDGKLEQFVKSEQFKFSNSITVTPDGQKLLISTGRGIVLLDPLTREATMLDAPFYIIGIDGLYTYKNSLIGIQNVTFPTSIVQFNLSNDFTSIERAGLLAVNHPLFDIPTTGVIVKDWFYFIGNSQLAQVADNGGKIRHPEKLKNVEILKLPLR